MNRREDPSFTTLEKFILFIGVLAYSNAIFQLKDFLLSFAPR